MEEDDDAELEYVSDKGKSLLMSSLMFYCLSWVQDIKLNVDFHRWYTLFFILTF